MNPLEAASEPAVIAAAPPRIGVLQSMRRHPVWAALPVILLLALAIFIGTARQPIYKAVAQASVGGVFVNNPAAVPGLLDATQSLASAYSRTVNAVGVVAPVARTFRTTPEVVSSRVSATPILNSPLIKLTATGGSAQESIVLANATVKSLIAYVTNLNRRNPDVPRFFAAFRKASREYSALLVRQQKMQRQFRASPSPLARKKLDAVTADTEAALLQREALRVSYQSSQQSVTSTPVLQLFSPANDATSDRDTFLEIALFAGLLAGLLVGTALATARANRAAARLSR